MTKRATVWDLKRNDFEGALAFAKERGDSLTPDESGVLLKLQDNPTKLERALRALGRSRASRH